MIFPYITLPSSIHTRTIQKDHKLETFIKHLAVLGPVLLCLSDVYSDPENFAVLKELLLTYLNHSDRSGRRCVHPILYLEGLSMEDKDVACAMDLLEEGLTVAFFKLKMHPGRIGEIEAIQRSATLSLFPRSRVGLSLSLTLSTSSTGMEEVLHTVQVVLEENIEHAAHFCFILYATPDSDIMLFMEKSTKIVMNFKSKDLAACEVTFKLPPRSHFGSSISEVSTAACILRDSVHICLLPTLILNDVVGEEHEVIRLKSPYKEESLRMIDGGEGCGRSKSSDGYGSVDEIDYISAWLGCLQTDRADGLYSTVVCDENGVCLGLVYSSLQSLRVAIFELRGVYWSRSKNSLWRKGENSGIIQHVLSLALDCDGDAIQFTVSVRDQQNKNHFCHLGRRTCFGWGLHQSGGFHQLQSSLQERYRTASSSSYTRQLFNSKELLSKKLIDEVKLLTDVTNGNECAETCANVMYYMMTKCVAMGVTVQDVEHQLDAKLFKIRKNM